MEEGKDVWFSFCLQKEEEEKRTYDYLIVMNHHRVHAPVWCIGLAISHTMHSKPGLPDLLALLPRSTIVAVEVLLVVTVAAPDFLLSQKANTGESVFPASSLSWIGQRFGDA